MSDIIEPLLQVVLQEDGNNDNTWGDIANAQLQKIINSIAARTTITLASGDVAMSDDQQRSCFLDIGGTLAANATLTTKTRSKLWVAVVNVTYGAFTAKVQSDTGGVTSTFTLRNGSYLLYCDASGNIAAVEPPSSTLGRTLLNILDAAAARTAISAQVAGTYAGLASNTFTASQTMQSSSTPVVAEATTDNPFQILFKSNGANRAYIGANSSYLMYVSDAGGAAKAYVDGSGNLTAVANVTAYSDARLKDEVVTITDALDKVDRMRGVSYRRIDSDQRRVGVIAQEVREVVPEVVIENPEDGMLSVSYGDLVGVLIEAVKELKAKVAVLEARA